MKDSIELRRRNIKILYLFTGIFIISLIFALTGSWAGIHHIVGLNSYFIGIPALFILVFIISSLIVLFISMWPISPDIEFAQVDEAKDVKQEKEKEKEKEILQEEKTLKQKEKDSLTSLKPDIEVKKEDKFEFRENEFLESSAYQYLFDYVKRMIEENDIHIYWEKIDLEDLLVGYNKNKSAGDENLVEGNSKKSGLSQLRLFLAKKRFYFSEKEFKVLVKKELIRQTYADFKNYVLSRNPQKLDDYILYFMEFVKEYEYPERNTREVVQKFINRELDLAYLKEILRENDIDFTDEDLYEEIRRVEEGLIF